MSTERGSKKRKTRSSCSGIELASAFHALQKFRHTVTEDFGPDNTNLESIELDTEIDEDALAQLDGLKTRSRCSRIALTSVFHILQKFRSTITEDFGPNNTNLKNTELDTEINEDTLVQLDGLLQWMDAKIKISTKSQSHVFSSASLEHVSNIQISPGPPLSLKDDVVQQTAAAKLASTDHLMSSKNMHKFLDMLLHLVAKPSEASSRTWVNAFLYRTSAMLPPAKQMVLNVEYNVSPVTKPTVLGSEVILVGVVDYTIIVTNDPKMAQFFLNNPGIQNLMQYIESVLGFFVVEAKAQDVKLDDHIPQIVLQLYATAKKLKKTHIRGILTNGYEWLFLVLTVNQDGKGASYRVSDHPYSAAPQENFGNEVIPDVPLDMISGILASWIEHSCEDLLEDDWFI
ncbi:hypothetical protein CVT25_008668 [Psilocybe cyanescens]|uniref:Uncharacterized protein n=1 Tax=Psilocybe cyanescens TaxID=93625 RepID=A0A409XL90_PSICY|nr:hypothetical protein CVT25_008668 [Psilocybe cyanescens]